MMKTLVLLSLSNLLPLSPSLLDGQSLPACNAAQVTYAAAPTNIEGRFHVSKVELPSNPPASGTRVNAVQGTRWFIEVDPNYMKADRPWTTMLYVGRSDESKAYLIASFKGHGNTFSAHWINEDLLFIQVWWGADRLERTDP